MNRLHLFTGAAALSLAGCANVATAPAPLAAPIALRQCEALAGLQLAPARIGLPTGGAVVTSAQRAPAVAPYKDPEGEHLLPTPERCLVLGEIRPVTAGAPPIKFAVNLPLANWNGRALQSGGGGMGGQLITAPGNKASGRFDPNPLDVPYPVTQGYATFGSDNGHPPGIQSHAFTRSEEAIRNWGHEELKKTRDTALAIIEAAYGRKPTHVFFSGESAGGREAVKAAQVYPQDYDGVIATSPVLSWNAIHLADNRMRDRLIDGWLDAAAIKLIADRTRASCDAGDGLKDGVIAKYLACANDVAQLQCKPGDAPGSCLTRAQVASASAQREPFDVGVPLAYGVTSFPGYAVTGDEDGEGWQWRFYPVGQEPPTRDLKPGTAWEPRRGATLNFAAYWIRHVIVGRDDFNPTRFDPKPYAQRLRELSELFDALDPDLARFAAHGGKLIIVHPSADNAAPLSMTAEYYGSVVRRMGPEATDRFLRLYVPAGGSHNVGGTSQVNALAMLEDWVLRGRTPPDAPVAYNLSLTDMRLLGAMPACRFPAYPQYDGRGDPREAASFRCMPRPDFVLPQLH
jgi:feruloyl esterase